MKVLVIAMKQLGVSIEEVKDVLQREFANKSMELDHLFIEYIEYIYASLKDEAIDGDAAVMTLAWLPLLNFTFAFWRATMLGIKKEMELQKLAYVGKDGREYQDQEALAEANDVYIRGLYRKVPRI